MSFCEIASRRDLTSSAILWIPQGQLTAFSMLLARCSDESKKCNQISILSNRAVMTQKTMELRATCVEMAQECLRTERKRFRRRDAPKSKSVTFCIFPSASTFAVSAAVDRR